MKASQPTSEIWDLLDAPPVDATPLLDMEKRMEKVTLFTYVSKSLFFMMNF